MDSLRGSVKMTLTLKSGKELMEVVSLEMAQWFLDRRDKPNWISGSDFGVDATEIAAIQMEEFGPSGTDAELTWNEDDNEPI